MKKNDESPPQPVWSLIDLLERVDNDQELLRELLTIFKEDFPRTIRSLEMAVSDGDMKSSATLGHTLKGMLSNLGGTRAAVAAARLEEAAAASKKASLRDAFETLQREAANLLRELDAYSAGVRR